MYVHGDGGNSLCCRRSCRLGLGASVRSRCLGRVMYLCRRLGHVHIVGTVRRAASQTGGKQTSTRPWLQRTLAERPLSLRLAWDCWPGEPACLPALACSFLLSFLFYSFFFFSIFYSFLFLFLSYIPFFSVPCSVVRGPNWRREDQPRQARPEAERKIRSTERPRPTLVTASGAGPRTEGKEKQKPKIEKEKRKKDDNKKKEEKRKKRRKCTPWYIEKCKSCYMSGCVAQSQPRVAAHTRAVAVPGWETLFFPSGLLRLAGRAASAD